MKILEQNEPAICTKALTIEVPREEIDEELDGVYKQFMSNANVPGFRRGKVPRKIAQLKFGKSLYDEAVNKAMETALKKAVEELDIKPVTQPAIQEKKDEDAEEDKSKPVVFEAKFEFMPTPETVEYQSISIEPGAKEVSEKEVNDQLQRLREQNAAMASVDDRSIQDQDYVTISSEATVDGDPFPEANHDEVLIHVGSGRYIPGFEEQLTGAAIGEEKTFELEIPDTHPIEKYRGKTGKFTIKVKQIQIQNLPELDDEFAKDMGDYETLGDLKDRIREDLAHNLEHRRQHEILDQIRDQLVTKNPIDVPPSMVQRRYHYLQQMADSDLRRYGTDLASAASKDEGLLGRYEKRAENDVRISILLHKIADEENIAVTDDEFSDYIQKSAGRHGADPVWFMRKIQENGMEPHFRDEALEEKVMKELVTRFTPAEEAEKAATKKKSTAKRTKKKKEEDTEE